MNNNQGCGPQSQRVIIPAGTINPNETSIIEIPKSLQNVSTVVARNKCRPPDQSAQNGCGGGPPPQASRCPPPPPSKFQGCPPPPPACPPPKPACPPPKPACPPPKPPCPPPKPPCPPPKPACPPPQPACPPPKPACPPPQPPCPPPEEPSGLEKLECNEIQRIQEDLKTFQMFRRRLIFNAVKMTSNEAMEDIAMDMMDQNQCR